MKITPSTALRTAAASLALLASAQLAQASLALNYQFNGKGNWSLDAVGSNLSPVGIVQAEVPAGSTVVKAFLYTTLTPSAAMGNITFDGNVLAAGSFSSLGTNPSAGLQAFRTDVTGIVSAKVGGGSASRFDFVISEANNAATDGSVLAIIYSNPAETERTIAFLDGFSDSAGDTFNINLGSPLIDPTTPGFEALFSLGIGYGFQTSGQFSQVDVNGRRLTTSAGGQDDGSGINGALVTVGGLDDSPLNPANPFANDAAGPRSDDELYNLALGNGVDSTPFLTMGATNIVINTRNPSNNDNIFFSGINITARAGVNQPPPPPLDGSAVPEPSTYGLIGAAALLGLVVRRRFKK